ncbi:Ubiquitin-protein ligase E3B, partial [Podochytrium sp. JEL0797]
MDFTANKPNTRSTAEQARIARQQREQQRVLESSQIHQRTCLEIVLRTLRANVSRNQAWRLAAQAWDERLATTKTTSRVSLLAQLCLKTPLSRPLETRLECAAFSFLLSECLLVATAPGFVRGPELRLLVKIAALPRLLSLLEFIPSALFDSLSEKSRIAFLLRKQPIPEAEKQLKPVTMWTNAMLHVILAKTKASNPSCWLLVSNFVFSVPLLLDSLDKSGIDLLIHANALPSCIAVLNTPSNFTTDALSHIQGELSLFLLGNLVSLLKLYLQTTPASTSSPVSSDSRSVPVPLANLKVSSQSANLVDDFVSAATRLLESCGSYVKSKSSNKTRFHPVLQWYSGPVLDIPSTFHTRLADTLSFLWSRTFIQTVFSDLLSFGFPPPPPPPNQKPKRTQFFAKLGFTEEPSSSPTSRTVGTVDEKQTILLSISTLHACQFYHQLTKIMLNSTTHILASLSWTPSLIPRLWRLINVVGPPPTGLLTNRPYGTQLFLQSAVRPGKEPLMPILTTFCESCCILFTTLDDTDIYQNEYPFLLQELSSLSTFLNSFCFNSIWNAGVDSGVAQQTEFDARTLESAQKLLGILYHQSSRRAFGEGGAGGPGDWIMKEVRRGDLVGDVKRGEGRAVAVLGWMPQCIPFGMRVDIFRHMVRSDKATIGEVPLIITVRRQTILEDGYRQLSKITLSQLKQTVKVRFVNELGLVEAGIDQNGVFKEFLEDICKRVFMSDYGLFRTTDDGNCVPSVSSSIHDDHLQLLEFVGRLFGKALYEGIVVDVPFATFVYAKMLGRLNFFEDLPSLDTQLHKNLLFLKHYEGNVEDLDLTFTIDEDIFGEIKSKEIKPGGAAI